MSHYLIRWDLDPAYAEFCEVPPGTFTWTVVQAEDPGKAYEAALESDSNLPDPTVERLTAICEVGPGLYGSQALIEYLDRGERLSDLVFDWEFGWQVVIAKGDRVEVTDLAVWLDPDQGRTDLIERSQLAGGGA